MTADAGFRRRPASALAAVSVVALVAWLVAGVVGAVREPQSEGADGFSRSPIGHRALIALLRESGYEAVVSRFGGPAVAGRRALYVALEPAPAAGSEDDEAPPPTRGAHHVLTALPKRRRTPTDGSDLPPDFPLLDEDATRGAARRYGFKGALVRNASAPFRSETLGLPPPILEPQVLAGVADAEAVIDSDAGALLLRRETEDTVHWLLTDPDPLATHGLAEPGGPAFALALIELALPPGSRTVVFDETLHGHEQAPGFWTRFAAPPLRPVLLHAVLIVVVLAWAASVRFGPADDGPRRRAEGKSGLVRLSAELAIAVRGGAAAALERHAEGRFRDAAAKLGIAADRKIDDLAAALDAATPAKEGRPRAALLWARIRNGAAAARAADDRSISELGRELAAWAADARAARRT